MEKRWVHLKINSINSVPSLNGSPHSFYHINDIILRYF